MVKDVENKTGETKYGCFRVSSRCHFQLPFPCLRRFMSSFHVHPPETRPRFWKNSNPNGTPKPSFGFGFGVQGFADVTKLVAVLSSIQGKHPKTRLGKARLQCWGRHHRCKTFFIFRSSTAGSSVSGRNKYYCQIAWLLI